MRTFNEGQAAFVQAIREAMTLLDDQSTEARFDALNTAKQILAQASPNADPVDVVRWIPAEQVVANDYNPNQVAPPEMELLRTSIAEDGYTQPIVCYRDNDADCYIVVDGFHRNRVGKEDAAIRDRIHGRLPVVVIDKDLADRIASTIRHNRARGTHGIAPMSHIVEELYFMGWTNKRIGEQLGMEPDEVLRLKQFTGLGALFASRDFSPSWTWQTEGRNSSDDTDELKDSDASAPA